MVDRALIPVEERTPAAPEIAQPAPADRTAIRFGPFAQIALQVGLVLGVGVLFRIELERGFAVLAAVIFGGFLIHSWLPSRWRVPFFVLLSMAAIALLLGTDAVWLIALGLGLVALCHLPIAWGARVVLALVAAAGLVAMQAGWITAPWEGEIVPILASMFMFRLILYMYDLKSERSPAGVWQRIAYFFLLPNVTFPLFPIVDYKNFLRNYYDAPAAEIYQKGTFWMLRGVTHLLLYRIVYHLLPLADSDLTGVVGVYAFMAMTFGLYLRISGIFHLIVGSLCLFGYNLPTTNHHYFLASGFSDLWRRANIYWRDFMMTVVFYPTFMMVRRWSTNTRLAFATAVVVVLTWFLHGYQWFWLRGAFPLTAPDLTFWGVLGLGLGINTLWESRRGRHRRLGRPEFSWKAALSITLRTIGFFTLMAFLFAMWNGGSIADWWYRLLLVRESDAVDWAIFGSLLGAAILIGVMAQWLAARGWSLQRVEGMAWTRAPVYVPAAALAILLIGLPAVHESIGGPVATVVGKAQSTKLNRIDREREERGYYETLSRATRFGAIPDRERDEELPDDWVGFRDSPAARRTGDLRGWEIAPGAVTAFKGVGFSANRWGMRDRDYTMDKPPGTYRLVLLGGSVDMGSGVEDDQTYENVLEDRLNREVAGRGFERYEILNFAVGGYGTLQSLYTLEHQVPSFDPDAVIVTIHPGDARRTADRLWSVLESGARGAEEYPDVMRILEQSEAHVGLPVDEFRRRVEPYRQELLRSSLRRMVASIRGQGAVPIFLFKSIPSRSFPRLELNRGLDFAREEGVVVIDITDVYEGYSLEELRITTWDNHPNPFGHRVIADRLYDELLRRADVLGLSGSRNTVSAGASP